MARWLANHVAAVSFSNCFNHCEAEPTATTFSRARRINSAKCLEYLACCFIRNTRAFIFDAEITACPRAVKSYSQSARISMLARILNSVKVRSSACYWPLQITLASWLSKSIWNGPTRNIWVFMGVSVRARRSTACTLATTSAYRQKMLSSSSSSPANCMPRAIRW